MKQVVIIGGGLAGLTAALHLRRFGVSVTLVEKNHYPHHKVCGEYISNEVLPYLDWLGVELEQLKPVTIEKLHFSAPDGKSIGCELPLGGFGVSRYALDHWLYQKAVSAGCEVVHAQVEDVHFKQDSFTIKLNNGDTLIAELVIGAYGKRANLDMKLKRDFITRKSSWLAVKSHYYGQFRADTVGLFHFKGGYCGVSHVDGHTLNICYLADYDAFGQHKNPEAFQSAVLSANPQLAAVFSNAVPAFEKPITIAQISFLPKKTVENHMLMVGDSAGLIHPLCGNGMAMAIHSAKMAAECVLEFLGNPTHDRKQMEQAYARQWRRQFARRLKMGKLLAKVLQNDYLSNTLMQAAVRFPGLLPFIVGKTHGKPIPVDPK